MGLILIVEDNIIAGKLFIYSLLEPLKITVAKRLLKSGRYQIGDVRFFDWFGWSWRKKKKD